MDLESVKKWYSKQIKSEVEEFDVYDLHVCRVLHKFGNDVIVANNNVLKRCECKEPKEEPIKICLTCDGYIE